MNIVTSGYRTNGYIVFRWLNTTNSVGWPESFRVVLAASKYRKDLYEVRERDTKHAGVRETYLVKLTGDDRARAIKALVVSGYSDDMRAPRWLALEMGASWPRRMNKNGTMKKASAS